MRGDPQNPELSSGGCVPCSTGFPGEVSVLEPICISAPAAGVVGGCVGLQLIFFLKILSTHFMMGDLGVHLLTLL